MLCGFRHRRFVVALAFALLFACAHGAAAQDRDEFDETAADPVKLFNRGQEAHAKKEFERALELYEEALQIKPDFAEAEFQKAAALVALKRLPDAEKSYRRAAELRKSWALPPAALGSMLMRTPGREPEAESLLRRALELDPKNLSATIELADLRMRAGDNAQSVTLLRRAVALRDDAAMWVTLARAELAAKDSASAVKSYSRAIELGHANVEARLGRADILIASGEKERALEDVRELETLIKSDWRLGVAVANRYGLVGKKDEARRVYDSLPAEARQSEEGRKLHAALTDLPCEDTPEARASLEQLVASEPKNAPAFACLGRLERTNNPERSAELYRRAAEAEPRNVDYAVGYAAALVQLRKFAEAAGLLQRVIAAAPEHYEAHANFAAALFELKLYNRAVVEYKWIERAKPELAVVHFFIAIAHDRLGEYEEALAEYEKFLARADAGVNQLEIEKVNLRLPSLRNQVKRGEGVKKDKRAQ
jgi:tetratricopeptide (TPR) repeat protein